MHFFFARFLTLKKPTKLKILVKMRYSVIALGYFWHGAFSAIAWSQSTLLFTAIINIIRAHLHLFFGAGTRGIPQFRRIANFRNKNFYNNNPLLFFRLNYQSIWWFDHVTREQKVFSWHINIYVTTSNIIMYELKQVTLWLRNTLKSLGTYWIDP